MGPQRFVFLRATALFAVLLGLLSGVACGSRDDTRADRRDEVLPPTPPKPRTPTTAPRIVILGDSLTAGLGLDVDDAYPAVLQRRLTEEGLNYEVVNRGVSGDTSAGGLSRLDWALDGDVRVLIVALGGNDALRGLPPDELKHNLDQIIVRAQAQGIQVVLAGMEAPPNWGAEYTRAFHAVYPALARQYHIPLVPFLLTGVAGIDGMNQNDHIHPNVRGAQIVADNVWKVLDPTLQRLKPRD
jgi:acyl-CoA thioesterase I